MALGPDVLGVLLEYVDSIDAITPCRHGDRTALRGGAECRCVSRSWRFAVEDVLSRSLPPMSSSSLAALLVPGKLHFVLLSCRRVEEHERGRAIAYAAVASRAEAVGLRLREAAGVAGGAATAPAALASPEVQATGSPMLLVPNQGVAAAVERPSASCRGGEATRSGNIRYGNLCCRVALKRIVEEALGNPAFSWCSSLGLDD
ncbi:unnamed protein product, partial [Hapterophycus canaliculatus]